MRRFKKNIVVWKLQDPLPSPLGARLRRTLLYGNHFEVGEWQEFFLLWFKKNIVYRNYKSHMI